MFTRPVTSVDMVNMNLTPNEKQWRMVEVTMQNIPSDKFILNIMSNHTYVAIDDIKMINCSFPRPKDSCGDNEFTCKDMSCIPVNKVHISAPDCQLCFGIKV